MVSDKYLKFGKYTSGCPDWFLDKIRDIGLGGLIDESRVVDILKVIRSEFDPKLHEITTTRDFRASRFIRVRDVLERHQRSCGSMSSVVAAVFRSLGVPTKLIDGMFVRNNPNMRHSWNEILIGEVWKPFDITRPGFGLSEFHVRKGEHIDWEELEDSVGFAG